MASRSAGTGWLGVGLVFLAAGCANHKPELLELGNQAVRTGDTLAFDVLAVDGDGDPLAFGISAKPDTASFEQIGNVARFSWSPLAPDAGADGKGKAYQVTFLVTDGIDTDSETITIEVTLGGIGAGAPVFITPSDHVLDLCGGGTIEFGVEVRDTDSASVTLRLLDPTDGVSFLTTPGTKKGRFSWPPSASQIAEKPVWGFRIGASDGTNPEVVQDNTVLIRGCPSECKGTPPAVTHEAPLTDSRSADDYPVVATAIDLESAVSVNLYYMISYGEGGSESYLKVPMEATGRAPDEYSASIPNPKLEELETAAITYYICAIDQDDQAGDACDLQTCLPIKGRHLFTAYAPGNTTCENDVFDREAANGTPAAATEIVFDSLATSVLESLKICSADEDWFVVSVPNPNYWVGAAVSLADPATLLLVDLYDQDGTSLLARSEVEGTEAIVISDAFAAAQDVFLRIRAENPAQESRYDLFVMTQEYKPCTADKFEPNDDPLALTVPLAPDRYTDLTACGEADWYRLDLEANDRLAIDLEFVHADGDLDLALWDRDTLENATELTCDNALACSTGEADNEQIVIEAVPAAGSYFLAVLPYQGAINGYDLTVDLVSGSQCTDDPNGGNGAPTQAVALPADGPHPGLVLCPGTEDWYKLSLTAGVTLKVDLRFASAAGDLDLRLYKPGVTAGKLWEYQLAESVGSGDLESVSYTVPAGGGDDYFVRVYGYKILGAGSTYEIEAILQ